MRQALKQRELQINMVKTTPPAELIQLLDKTYESEKELFDFKLDFIEKEKNKCLEELNKITKIQSGVFGMFRIAHSSMLEEINTKLEMIK